MKNGIVRAAASFCRAIQQAYARKSSFLGSFVIVLILSFGVLSAFGLTPNPIVETQAAAVVLASTTHAVSTSTPEVPVKIAIPSINLSATVSDPTTTDVEVLDTGLLTGAVRYPTSALLGAKNGNVVIFGHSSYLPVVNNQAYKTFNGIQKLKEGDLITVYSSTAAYTYAVDTVNKEDATEAGIPLVVTGQELTLSTCDSFATKSDRFVVTAHFVESHPIATS